VKVAILYYRLFDADGREQMIGGVETYLLNLGALCAEIGWEPTLFQCSNRPFERAIGDLKVVGVPVPKTSPSSNWTSFPWARHKRRNQALFEAATKSVDLSKDLLIFGADHHSVPTNSRRCIAIQHGVDWDLPSRFHTKKMLCKSGWGARLKKATLIYAAIKSFENCPNRVCVDYNFLNWYRTLLPAEPAGRIWVIPNFALVASPDQVHAREEAPGVVRVLFARRFTEYRGTRIMAEAAKRILRMNKDVEFTFAGEGPDEEWLQRHFAGEQRVTFTKFLPPDTIRVHLKYHIAVVPSLASEGTSFSVAEAMAAGCAVVATAVGGITNMILDGYNGLLVMPDAASLAAGLERLVADAPLRARLGRTAYETAVGAFNLDRWKAKWREVLEKVANG